ncbi:LysR family transcriptional regulator [Paraburkholderia tropica]|uniref:LysR family transcriptional regulator n=1 Tax=Paraburkholderia tropica TaxID=92647 RepID=UPI001F1DE9C7|nr:LysR substrate-binding domain-containing protein [Paraburkholderia tropica]
MKFHQLRALIAVAEHGSIHEASRELHLTQPAISKAVADLESELGAPLLTRSAKGAQLTHYGKSLIRHARVIDQEMRHAHEDIARLLGVARGSVTIGVTPVTAQGPFAEALRQFIRMHPEVAVNVRELRPTLIQEGLADGSIDFGLVSRIGSPEGSRFHWEQLYSVPTTLAVRARHPLRGAQSLAVLAQSAWLSWDALDDASSLVGTLFNSTGIAAPKSVLRCTSTTLYMEMATSTDLISLWSELPFHMPELNGSLKRIVLKESLPNMTIGLVCRDLDVATTVATSFMELVRSCSTELKGPYASAGALPRSAAGKRT